MLELGETEVCGKDQPLLIKSHLQIRDLPLPILLVRCMHLPMFSYMVFFPNTGYSIDVTEPLILPKHFTVFGMMSLSCKTDVCFKKVNWYCRNAD